MLRYALRPWYVMRRGQTTDGTTECESTAAVTHRATEAGLLVERLVHPGGVAYIPPERRAGCLEPHVPALGIPRIRLGPAPSWVAGRRGSARGSSQNATCGPANGEGVREHRVQVSPISDLL